MKNLIASSEDAWAVFAAICDAKHEPNRSILLALSSRLQERYGDYGENRMNLEHIGDAAPAFDAPHQAALRHCYRVPTPPLKQLKQRIARRQSAVARSKCQHCGIDSPGTWDHYLPQAEFPEFSVYPDNLAPCCSRCNSHRGDGWRQDGERVHLNLYFDAIEVKERFLVARIGLDSDGQPYATFEVDRTRGGNQAFARRYERHCRALALLKRFEEAAPAQLSHMALDIRSSAALLERDTSAIARQLRWKAAELQDLLGANNWEVALHMAAAESPQFIDYCLDPWPEHPEVFT